MCRRMDGREAPSKGKAPAALMYLESEKDSLFRNKSTGVSAFPFAVKVKQAACQAECGSQRESVSRQRRHLGVRETRECRTIVQQKEGANESQGKGQERGQPCCVPMPPTGKSAYQPKDPCFPEYAPMSSHSC